eukprot:COSAG01_NODE_441_length_17032_cov_27.546389_5_plen_290_part_00
MWGPWSCCLCLSQDLDALNFAPDIEAELGFVSASIRRTRELLNEEGRADVCMIGFTGGPWTLMTYMLGEMGGGGGGVFAKAKKWLYTYPDASERLLSGIADVVGAFLIEQARAGAQMCQVFDSWAGALSPSDFVKWELPALTRVARTFKAACPDTPLIVMPKGAHHALASLAAVAEIDVIGLDWTTPCAAVRGEGVSAALAAKTVQGNLDPAFLMAPPAEIEAAVAAMAAGFTRPASHDGGGSGRLSGYIVNVGNGLLTTTPVEGVAAMVRSAQRWRPPCAPGPVSQSG